MSILARLAVLVVGAALAAPVRGALISVTADDAGFVTSVGGSAKGDGTISPATYNYSVGWELHYSDGSLGIPPGSTPLAPLDKKNYFVFDLSGVSEPIVSATLHLYTGLFESVDPSETFVVTGSATPFSALADAGALMAGNGIGPSVFNEPTDPLVGVAAALYTKLSSIPGSMGTAIVDSSLDGTTLSVPLTPSGIAYLNFLAGGPLILGGLVTTVTPPTTPQQPFGLTGPDIPGGDPLTPYLEIVTLSSVPEPSVVMLGFVGWLVLRAIRRCPTFASIRLHSRPTPLPFPPSYALSVERCTLNVER